MSLTTVFCFIVSFLSASEVTWYALQDLSKAKRISHHSSSWCHYCYSAISDVYTVEALLDANWKDPQIFQPECSGNLPKVSSLNLFLSLNCFKAKASIRVPTFISHRIEDFEMTLNSSISLVNYLFIPAQTFFVLPI